MSGVEYLLDSNIVIGVLKRNPDTLALLKTHQISLENCGYSSITRVEILSFPKGTQQEYKIAEQFLSELYYYNFNQTIENKTIILRRQNSLKLPDAIILATAQIHNLKLLTHDKKLQRLSGQSTKALQ